jgi:uncharacterized membrane protein
MISAFLAAVVIVLIFIIYKLNKRVKRLEERVNYLDSISPEKNITPGKREGLWRRYLPKDKMELEAFIGGKILNLIGALALIIGVAFFLQYAFENQWVTETIRIAAGFLMGGILIYGGHFFYKRNYLIFTQGLTGAGIATLYLSVFASYSFYSLLPLPVAFLLMVAITIFTFIRGIKYNAQAIVLLGLAGGLLTPYLLESGWGNELILFGYLMILTAGVLIIAVKKREWRIIEPAATLGIYIIFLSNYLLRENNINLWIPLLFLVFFWGAFLATNVLRNVKMEERSRLTQLIPSANFLLFAVMLYLLMAEIAPDLAGGAFLAAAIIYFIVYNYLRKRGREGREFTSIILLISFVALIIATEIELLNYFIIAAISVEAFLFLWYTTRREPEGIWKSVFIIYILAAGRILFIDNVIAPAELPLFNLRGMAFLLFAVSLLAGRRLLVNYSPGDKVLEYLVTYGVSIFLFLFITIEITAYFALIQEDAIVSRTHLWLSGTWLIYTVILLITGFIQRITSLRQVAILLFGITILKIFIYDLSFLETFYRIISFFALGLILLLVSYLYQRYKPMIFEDKK